MTDSWANRLQHHDEISIVRSHRIWSTSSTTRKTYRHHDHHLLYSSTMSVVQPRSSSNDIRKYIKSSSLFHPTTKANNNGVKDTHHLRQNDHYALEDHWQAQLRRACPQSHILGRLPSLCLSATDSILTATIGSGDTRREAMELHGLSGR